MIKRLLCLSLCLALTNINLVSAKTYNTLHDAMSDRQTSYTCIIKDNNEVVNNINVAFEDKYIVYNTKKIKYVIEGNKVSYKIKYIDSRINDIKARKKSTKIIKNLKLNNSDKDTVIKLNKILKYMSKNYKYSKKVKKPRMAYTLLTKKKGNCQGYANLFYLLCKKANIEVSYAETKYDNGLHLINIVKIDKKYYYVDSVLKNNQIFGKKQAKKLGYKILNDNGFKVSKTKYIK